MPHPSSADTPAHTPGASAGERLAKLLARAGVASRREVERMIAEGRVALDGKVIDTPATVLRSLAGITVDGDPVAATEPARLFLYHKPPGLLVTERDPAGRPTIYDRLPRDLPRVVPVGRLDLNTEGLLLLTTDGGLKRQLELPATGVERAYRARAYGQVSQAQLEDLIDGVEIEGVRYGKIDANLERRTGANVWIEMILTEGKNREVRRVLEHLGLRVSRLIRTRYGPFVLGDLPAGEVGEVLGRDLEAFRNNPKALPPARTTPSRELRAPESLTRRPRPEREASRRPVPGGRQAGDPNAGPTRPARSTDPERRPRPPASVRDTAPRAAAPARPDVRREGPRAPAGDRPQRIARTDVPTSGRPARPPRPDARAPNPSKSDEKNRRSPSAARRTASFDRRVDDRTERADRPARRDTGAPRAGSPRSDTGRNRRAEATDRTFAPRPPSAARADRPGGDARPERTPLAPSSGRPPRSPDAPRGDRSTRPSGGDRPARGPSGGRGHPPRKR